MMENKKLINLKVGNPKRLLKTFIAVVLIITTFLINGFLSFMTIGFDFSAIFGKDWWINMAILYGSEILIVVAIYILNKQKSLSDPRIVTIQKLLRNRRQSIEFVDKVRDTEDWLKDCYNRLEKISLYEAKLKKIYKNITAIEPKKITKKDIKLYDKRLAKYTSNKEKQDYILEQLAFCKEDRERIRLLVNSKRTAEEQERFEYLNGRLLDDKNLIGYNLEKAKISYIEVYWGTLSSDTIEEEGLRNNSPYFFEKKELSKRMSTILMWGLLFTTMISSITHSLFNGFNEYNIMMCFIRLISLLGFMITGLNLSDQLILGNYYHALQIRKKIYSQIMLDLNIIEVSDKEVEESEKDLEEQLKK